VTSELSGVEPRPAALGRIDVLALGGTIAMRSSRGAGASPQLSADDLVAAVPGLSDLAQIHARSVRTLPGASLSFADVVETALIARRCVDDGAAGVVVTQGTDSLEETCYVLDLLWDRPEPLVVTGAMRPATAPGADGPANLWAASAVAVAPESRGRGCLVVFADQIYSARDVAKVHSTGPAAFAAPGAGPVGGVTEGRPEFSSPPGSRLAALAPIADQPPHVALVSALLGDDGRQLQAVIDGDFGGVVLAAMGAGHVPERMLGAIASAVEHLPVAVVSRTNAGLLLRETYEFPGSERDLHRLGVLDGAGLGALKARVLLTLSLWSAPDRATAEAAFRHRAATRY
jgi:L-asparaginase